MTVPLVVGNWKMNGSQAQCQKLACEIARMMQRKPTRAQVVVAPPFTALSTVARAIRHSKIKMAGAKLSLAGKRCLHRGNKRANVSGTGL